MTTEPEPDDEAAEKLEGEDVEDPHDDDAGDQADEDAGLEVSTPAPAPDPEDVQRQDDPSWDPPDEGDPA